MRLCFAATLVALFAIGAVPAAAQDWPTGPVRIIVPFGPGSTPDTVAHLLADRLNQNLGQPFVVEDRPGASGNLGTDTVAKAQPGGATLGVSIGGPLAINPLLFASMPYDPEKDLIAVSLLATQPSVLAVNASLNVATVPELIALLKGAPGKYNFASIGTGSLSHLAMVAIGQASGTQIVHVPYASSPQAVTALMRNDVQLACLPAISITPQLTSGTMRILAVSTAARSPLLPDIPTLKESGIDVEADAWMGLIAPAKTSDAVVAAIGDAVAKAMTAPDIRARLAAQLMEPIPGSPAEFRARIAADVARWAPVIKAANIRIE